MSKPFNMELFLAGVLSGSYTTRQRHLGQAKLLQTEISERWQLETPWTWQKKHVVWLLEHRLNGRSEATRHYYLLTVRLLVRRLQKNGFSISKLDRRYRPIAACRGTSSRIADHLKAHSDNDLIICTLFVSVRPTHLA